ncbi:hypothetical protein VNO78_30477 [Psophocarpus tetragonolobus]|uniref:Uncharacterized protein n=1 Tax=Psophocarpus tetragonolobus TaxID=3891 RepID=A0AAN9RXE2_PSOTE
MGWICCGPRVHNIKNKKIDIQIFIVSLFHSRVATLTHRRSCDATSPSTVAAVDVAVVHRLFFSASISLFEKRITVLYFNYKVSDFKGA